ncbi:PEP-CTERM sorting domain-containing protein [Phenylobacterium kunshanense]|nr:PEP-CTERM sorting domain-containing protein [Phenylobacterium kunshanense]
MRVVTIAALAAIGAVCASPAAALTPISGLVQLQTHAFVLGGDVADSDTGAASWTGAPQARIAFTSSQATAARDFDVAGVNAYGSANGQWAPDGASGSVSIEFGWALSNTADFGLMGASFNDLNPNWSYTFRADRDGLLIWEGQVVADRTVPGNDPFGLTGWDLQLNGATVIDLTDPNGPLPRTGDGDFALVGGQTYTLSLTNFSNIAGRQFSDANYEPHRGRVQGQFWWAILEEPASPVPEPGTWALMMVGLATVGTSLRGARRRMARA